MALTVYQYPNCDTCRKALRWLDAHGIAHTAVHIVESPPSAAALEGLIARSGLPVRRFFNTAGRVYRSGGWREKVPGLDAAGAAAALAADGMLIKRPLVDVDGRATLVGFQEAAWQAALGDRVTA